MRYGSASRRPAHCAVGQDVELDHLQPPAAGVDRGLERRAVRLQPGVVRIVAVRDRLAEDAPGRDERRHVVGVAAGAILEQAVLEPDRVLDAEELSERGLARPPVTVPDCGSRAGSSARRAISVPSPSVVTAPPSSTSGTATRSSPSNSARPGPDRLAVRRRGQRRPPAVEEEVDGHELGRSLRAKIGPESRSQASPSGSSTTSTPGRSTRPPRDRTRASRPSAPARTPRSPCATSA